MLRSNHLRFQTWVFVGAAILLFCRLSEPAQQPAQPQPVPEFKVTVLVKDAATGDPLSQARLTLTFRYGKLHHSTSYGAKTNAQGRYQFTGIPKGTVHLFVTAEHHQSFGKELEVEQDNQVIEVKLKKPQPLL
jgi:hypothetical protein